MEKKKRRLAAQQLKNWNAKGPRGRTEWAADRRGALGVVTGVVNIEARLGVGRRLLPGPLLRLPWKC